MKRKTALILGISGQTGSYIAHLLLHKGYRVIGTSRNAKDSKFLNLVRIGIKDKIELRSVSLSDFRDVMTTMQEIEPDEVYNLAGQSSVALSLAVPMETFESVALTTMNVLECLRIQKRPVRLFNATSTDCFGCTRFSATEETAFRPQSPYAMAKAASFWSVASYRSSYGLHASNGILSNHESPLRPDRFVTRKVIMAANRIASGSKEQLLLGDLSVERDWGWAPDYAFAIWKIIQHETPADFIVATGKTSSLRSFVQTAFDTLGLNYDRHVEIDPNLFRHSEIPRVAVDSTLIRKMLGWRPTVTMPDLVHALLRSEQTGDLGPVPWQDGIITDGGKTEQ